MNDFKKDIKTVENNLLYISIMLILLFTCFKMFL